MKRREICIFQKTDPVLKCVAEMTEQAKQHQGDIIGAILDGRRLLGSLSDGDIRRYLLSDSADITSDAVDKAMSNHAVSVKEREVDSIPKILSSLDRKIKSIFVVDESGDYCYTLGLEDNGEIFEGGNDAFANQRIVVVGLGFVGLTLAVHIAKAGFSVVGVDANTVVVESLSDRVAPFFEQGLQSSLDGLSESSLSFENGITKADGDTKTTFIVAVGTPISNGEADVSQLKGAINNVAENINNGDLLIIRSTVPIGTCSGFVTSLMSEKSLVAGENYFLAMAPERTAEGVALSELQTLPQIIGADDSISLHLADRFFSEFSASTISVGSTVAAETCKLVCNSWRDLGFGFANELAILCEANDIDAFDLINSCNFGYKRMTLPLPSPGVGGYCLTKDPLLYASSGAKLPGAFSGNLSIDARKANVIAGMAPDRALENFIRRVDPEKTKKLKLLVCGLTFKGAPETDDIRYSTSIEFIDRAISMGHDVIVTDSSDVVLSKVKNRLSVFSLRHKVEKDVDAIFVLNNNPENTNLNYSDWLISEGEKLFFDGWHQFNGYRHAFEDKAVKYATMGVVK